MTRLRTAIAERFPDVHAAAAAYATRCYVPLTQVPPRGVWGRKGQVTVTPVDAWLGRPLGAATAPDGAVLRYLAAFGPATVADVAAWCRLTGMREVLDRLAPRLRTFTDERGRTLYDVPDGLLPDPDVEAPVRFLPEYDNSILSFADRNRFGSDPDRRFSGGRDPFKGSVLVDGRVRADLAPRARHAEGPAGSRRDPPPADRRAGGGGGGRGPAHGRVLAGREGRGHGRRPPRPAVDGLTHSTVTLLARLRGRSTSRPSATAAW